MKHQDFRSYRGQARSAARGRSLGRRRGRLDGLWVALVALAAAYGGIGWSEAEAPGGGAGSAAFAAAPAPVGQPAGVRVVDGDTFWLAGEKIRIADIDTPEVRARCAAEARLAAAATRRLGTLLRAGPFTLEPIPGRDEDRYGRKLRVVTRGGRSLGDQLVSEGLARTWSGRREPWC